MYARRKSQYKKRTWNKRKSPKTYAIKTAEKKSYYTEWDAAGISDAGDFTTLNLVNATAGVTNGRLNQRITMLGLYIKLHFTPSASDENNKLRILLGVSKGPVYVIGDMPGSLSAPPDNTKYHVLFDRILAGCVHNSADGVVGEGVDLYFNMKAKQANFDGANGTNLNQGQIFLFMISDSDAIPNPTIFGYTRLVFCDL